MLMIFLAPEEGQARSPLPHLLGERAIVVLSHFSLPLSILYNYYNKYAR